MNDLLDEVQQDLSDEKYYFYIRKIAKIFVVASIIVILGVSIYVWKEYTTRKLQEKMSIWFSQGLTATEENKLEEAISYFDNIIQYPHQNYASLAYLNKAAILFKQGKKEEAQKALQEMSAQKHFKSVFRELGQLIYLSNKIDNIEAQGSEEEDVLEQLTKENKAWRFSALQLKAMYEIKVNKLTEAKANLNKIIDDKQANKASKDSAAAILSVISRK